ncbi:MAG: CYTH domain-containing protein [Motiliproteus sp.]
MAQEIELKLSLPQAYQSHFTALALLQGYALEAPQLQVLQNRYFDTPDQQLNRHAVALRIRRNGDRYIQTLKTRGSSQGGLHQRQEWEWPVPGATLDFSVLPPQAFPDGVAFDTLAVAFNTDFERTCWMLDYPYQGQQASIELVLDNGWVSTQDQRDPISEIELELKSGPTEALFELALTLAAELPLRISRISKAEKGFRLLQPEQARRIPAAPVVVNRVVNRVENRFDLQAAQQWLERIQALLESYAFIADVERLSQAPAAFAGLGQQLAIADGVADDLLNRLTKQQQALSLLLAEADPEVLLQQWLDDRSLGLCLLQTSQWLYQQR